MKASASLYLDHAATTPVLPQVQAAMADAMAHWANPSSPHASGRKARAMLEQARADIATALDWNGEIILTSGASESIAIGLRHAAIPVSAVSAMEHAAVLRVASAARRMPVDERGQIDLGDIAPASLIAVQQVNNETGVIQDSVAIADQVHDAGAYLFCDAAQSAGKLDLPGNADMISISAHKLGGPPGIGALLIRDLALLNAAGGQEKGYRQGTENMPAAVGFAAALSASKDWLAGAQQLRNSLDSAVRCAGGVVIADGANRIASIASYAIPNVPSASQLIRFDMGGIAVSAGSACSSGTLKASPVLSAMGLSPDIAECAIRVSFGPDTRAEDIEFFLDIWSKIAKLRS
jgi:cysteine desulfurase